MNRRQFFHVASASAVALAIDPERLLWEPGKRVYFDLWTPPQFSIGDWVVFHSAVSAAVEAHRDINGEWVYVRPADIERVLTTIPIPMWRPCPRPHSHGRVGVVVGRERGLPTIQTYGICLTPLR